MTQRSDPRARRLFGIARITYARHRERGSRGDHTIDQLAARVELGEDEIEELSARIDAQRQGAELLRRLASLPELEREALELVDLDGFTAKEAAISLGISAGALRVRLFRARTKLRKDAR
jgi:RNA polymerase sigma factor (sigma-70 family)